MERIDEDCPSGASAVVAVVISVLVLIGLIGWVVYGLLF